MEYISENIRKVKENIRRAAIKSGRDSSEVTLIAVTKTYGVEAIQHALDEGVFNLGENKVQELLGKYDQLGETPKWHLIGHLQTNKVKYIVDKVAMIHSLESIKLAEEINKRAEQNNMIAKALVEINIADENSKFGINPENCLNFLQNIGKFDHLKVCGLMCIAPYVENGETNRDYFRQMKKIFVDIKGKNIDNVSMEFLSMGMSGDYEVAIEEGANMVRIGTGIFGARTYL